MVGEPTGSHSTSLDGREKGATMKQIQCNGCGWVGDLTDTVVSPETNEDGCCPNCDEAMFTVVLLQSTKVSREFPDFVVDFELPEGFEDSSWHNDAMTSWIHASKKLHLFVNYADKELQEIGTSRFCLSRVDDNLCCFDVDESFLFETDDLSELVEFVNNYKGGCLTITS
jgi:hypothetical protein